MLCLSAPYFFHIKLASCHSMLMFLSSHNIPKHLDCLRLLLCFFLKLLPEAGWNLEKIMHCGCVYSNLQDMRLPIDTSDFVKRTLSPIIYFLKWLPRCKFLETFPRCAYIIVVVFNRLCCCRLDHRLSFLVAASDMLLESLGPLFALDRDPNPAHHVGNWPRLINFEWNYCFHLLLEDLSHLFIFF